MRISELPCLTFVLYFHVLDYFRILVHTAPFHLTCMHAYSCLVGLPLHVCVWMYVREQFGRLVTYVNFIYTLFLSSVFWVQFPAPSCRTYFLWQKRRCLYAQFYIQSDPPAQLWHSSSALQARRCSVPVWRRQLKTRWQMAIIFVCSSWIHQTLAF